MTLQQKETRYGWRGRRSLSEHKHKVKRVHDAQLTLKWSDTMKRLTTLFLILAASLTLTFAQQTGGSDAAQMAMSEQTLQELRDLYDQLGTLIAELEEMGMTGGDMMGTGGVTSGTETTTLDETGGAMTGGDTTGDITGDMTGGVGEAPTLEGTISALEGGVESMALETAISNIEGWQAALNEAGYNDIADELGALATALQADPMDVEEVNGLLLGLGAQTTAAADNATDEETSSQLARLGSLLTELGSGAGTTGGSN